MVTVVTSTIGATARDYATTALWEAAIPANLVTDDEQWVGEMYNDAEFTGALTINGHTTDATRDIILRPATGEGFRQHADVLTNALRYNQSNGVGIARSTAYGVAIQISDAFVTLFGLQVDNSGYEAPSVKVSDDDCLIDSCILYGTSYGGEGTVGLNGDRATLVNSLIVSRDTSSEAIDISYTTTSTDCKIINCTVISPANISNSNEAINSYGGTGDECKGNLILGFGSAIIGTFSTEDYNASDDTTMNGANSLDSLTAADQVESLASIAALDARVKVGADVIGAGIQYTETNDLDIAGSPRSVSTPTIGAWEFISFTLDQEAFRFYDDGTESGSTALEAQNTDLSIAKETIFQIRVGAQAVGDPPTQAGTLQLRISGSGENWEDV